MVNNQERQGCPALNNGFTTRKLFLEHLYNILEIVKLHFSMGKQKLTLAQVETNLQSNDLPRAEESFILPKVWGGQSLILFIGTLGLALKKS